MVHQLPALFQSAYWAEQVRFDHWGAILGIDAKAVIDIMASVKSITVADSLLEILCNSDYDTSPEFNATIGKRRWLMRYKDDQRTHHLHLVEHYSSDLGERLALRDALRSNEDLAYQYLQLKKDLMTQHFSDRENYTNAKSEFIRDVLNKYAT